MELRNHIANLGATVPDVVRAIGGGSAFVLLVYYAARCGRGGYCNATQAEIAADLEMDERHVRRAKAALVAAGAIVSTVATGAGGRDRAHVTVCMGWCGESGRGADFAPRGGAENARGGGAPDAPRERAKNTPRGGTPTRARIKTRPETRPIQDPPQEARANREQGRGSTSTAQPLPSGGVKTGHGLRVQTPTLTWSLTSTRAVVALAGEPPAEHRAFLKRLGLRYCEREWLPVDGDLRECRAWVLELPGSDVLDALSEWLGLSDVAPVVVREERPADWHADAVQTLATLGVQITDEVTSRPYDELYRAAYALMREPRAEIEAEGHLLIAAGAFAGTT